MSFATITTFTSNYTCSLYFNHLFRVLYSYHTQVLVHGHTTVVLIVQIKVAFHPVSVKFLSAAYSGMFYCHSILLLSLLPLYPIGRMIHQSHYKLRVRNGYNSIIFNYDTTALHTHIFEKFYE